MIFSSGSWGRQRREQSGCESFRKSFLDSSKAASSCSVTGQREVIPSPVFHSTPVGKVNTGQNGEIDDHRRAVTGMDSRRVRGSVGGMDLVTSPHSYHPGIWNQPSSTPLCLSLVPPLWAIMDLNLDIHFYLIR